MSINGEEIAQRLESLAVAGAPDSGERVVTQVSARLRSRRRRTGAFVAGVASAAAVLAGYAIVDEPAKPADGGTVAASDGIVHLPSNTQTGAGDSTVSVEPGEPCSMAKHAQRVEDLATNVPIWTPAGEKISDAWTCGSTPVLLYGDIQISYEPGWAAVDIESKWARMVERAGGRVETILDRPAYVHPADKRGPRNGVMIVIGDQLIRVTATPEVPIERLVTLTSKIQLPSSVQQ